MSTIDLLQSQDHAITVIPPESLASSPPPSLPEDWLDWPKVRSLRPCGICGAESGDCRRGPEPHIHACRNVVDHLGREATDNNGNTYYLYNTYNLRKRVIEELRKTFEVFHPEGVIEVRIFTNVKWEKTIAGYFDNPSAAAEAVAHYDSRKDTEASYFALNPILPEILARSPNKLMPNPKVTVCDNDVDRLCWLFVDCDPIRPKGISSTPDQLAAAVCLADRVKSYLVEAGFPQPVEAASGNGRHLLFRMDLPNTKEHAECLKAVLKVLQDEVAAPWVAEGNIDCKVDHVTFNPSRIDKLYGTMARKGHPQPDRPWRRSRLLVIPDPLQLVSVEALQAVAAKAHASKVKVGKSAKAASKSSPGKPATETAKPAASTSPADERPVATADRGSQSSPRLRVEAWLADSGVATRPDGLTSAGLTKHLLDHCLFNEAHDRKDAVFLTDPDGQVFYNCLHDSCQDKDIAAVADLIGYPEQHHFDGAVANKPRLDVEAWLATHDVASRRKLLPDGRDCYVIACPFDPSHDEACITQDVNGKLGARCKGEGCEERKWKEFKQKIGPPRRDFYDPPLPQGTDGADTVPTTPRSGLISLPSDSGYDPGFMTSAAFAAGDFRLEWLVRNVLVKGQPALIGGPQKALKTSTTLDLVISLGSGRPYLGKFEVEKRVRVAILSGESGEAVLQETARRICAAKGIDLATVDVLWGFRLPQLADDDQMLRLKRHLREHRVEVVVIDPLYLCLLAGQGAEGLSASNLYQMGPLLLSVARACLDVGCTPFLLHHTKKTIAEPYKPLGLEDLAFAGVAEFARQWKMVSRREPYTHGSGVHKLWLACGGSAGHGGLWVVDVEEGVLQEDFKGRRWVVTVGDGTDARRTANNEKRNHKDREEECRLLQALDRLDPQGEGANYTKVRAMSRLNNEAMTRTIDRLKEQGVIEEFSFEILAGKGAKRHVNGLRRTPVSPGRTESVPVIPGSGPSSVSSGLFDLEVEVPKPPAAATSSGPPPKEGAVRPDDVAATAAERPPGDSGHESHPPLAIHVPEEAGGPNDPAMNEKVQDLIRRLAEAA